MADIVYLCGGPWANREVAWKYGNVMAVHDPEPLPPITELKIDLDLAPMEIAVKTGHYKRVSPRRADWLGYV